MLTNRQKSIVASALLKFENRNNESEVALILDSLFNPSQATLVFGGVEGLKWENLDIDIQLKIEQLYSSEGKIPAIKALRTDILEKYNHKPGLKWSKDFVENMASRFAWHYPYQQK